eukprot:GCRY01003077.1.p1 GENE.GCRY01003077.1~~GCRY01003077.1.p1  ORF type:complete len:298 (-),score=49.48 GCRY01003077.1:21-914(-)
MASIEDNNSQFKKRFHDRTDGSNSHAKRMRFKDREEARFQFGNYDRYYGYRNKEKEQMENDPRLALLETEWFEGKCCLDIGCNVGNLTLQLARQFNPQSMVGIDIDNSLIVRAQRNIYRSSGENEKRIVSRASDRPWDYFPISLRITHGPLPMEDVERKKDFENLPPSVKNTRFMMHNIIEPWEAERGCFDTIVCFSVTKWIHLNWGDEGIKKMFKNIYDLLKPDGVLLLEPQPYSSYRKKAKMTQTTADHFKNISIRPESFAIYLTSEVGFKSTTIIGVPQHPTKGFDRPIYLCQK